MDSLMLGIRPQFSKKFPSLDKASFLTIFEVLDLVPEDGSDKWTSAQGRKRLRLRLAAKYYQDDVS